eukprot:scaffold85314_cov30-Tisochrysis_lutea.AAC.2
MPRLHIFSSTSAAACAARPLLVPRASWRGQSARSSAWVAYPLRTAASGEPILLLPWRVARGCAR